MRKYNDAMRFARTSLDALTYLVLNEDKLPKEFDVRYPARDVMVTWHGAYSVSVSSVGDPSPYVASIFEKARTNYVYFAKNRNTVNFITKDRTLCKMQVLTDLSPENFFQQSLLYPEDAVLALFMISYYNLNSTIGSFSYEVADMKHFIKTLKGLK